MKANKIFAAIVIFIFAFGVMATNAQVKDQVKKDIKKVETTTQKVEKEMNKAEKESKEVKKEMEEKADKMKKEVNAKKEEVKKEVNELKSGKPVKKETKTEHKKDTKSTK